MPIECSTERCLPSVFVSYSFSMRSSTMLFINVVSHVRGNSLLIVALFVRIWCRMNPNRPTQQRWRAASIVGIIVDIAVVVVLIAITIVIRTPRRIWRWSVVIVARTPMNISDRRNLLFMNRWVRASEQITIVIFMTNPRRWPSTRIDQDHKWFSNWTVAVGNGIPPYRWRRWLIWPVVYGMRPRRPISSARESTPSLPPPTVEPNIPRPVDRRLQLKIHLIKHRSCWISVTLSFLYVPWPRRCQHIWLFLDNRSRLCRRHRRRWPPKINPSMSPKCPEVSRSVPIYVILQLCVSQAIHSRFGKRSDYLMRPLINERCHSVSTDGRNKFFNYLQAEWSFFRNNFFAWDCRRV